MIQQIINNPCKKAQKGSRIDQNRGLDEVCRFIPYQSTKFLCGDWNVDQLPASGQDPCAALPERKKRHKFERQYLKAFFDRMGVSINLPQQWASNQPPVVRAYNDHIVTRLPTNQIPKPEFA